MQKTKSKCRKANTTDGLAISTLVAENAKPVGALGARDSARYLSISLPTLRRQVHEGKLIPSRMTRHLLFSIKELNRWIEEGQVE